MDKIVKIGIMNLPLGLSAFIGFSILFAPAAHSVEIQEKDLSSPTVAQISSDESLVTNSQDPVAIEERIEGIAGTTTREYAFNGNENEMIVVYTEAFEGYVYDTSVVLTDLEGNVVSSRSSYHEGLDLAESEGRHKVFLLPTTGEYRLRFDSISYDDEPESVDYLLRARLASYPERLIIHGSRMMDEANYEAAIATFTLAIEESPEQPLPYMGRIFASALPAFEEMDENDFKAKDPFSVVYETFKAIEPETQLSVIDDMKQMHIVLNALIAEGKATPESLDIDPELFAEGAIFLETGVVSDSLAELVGEFL